MSIKFRLTLLIIATMAGSAAQAATKGYGLSTAVGQSDNITRTATDEQDETVASAGLNFALAEKRAHWRANATADLAWLDYLENTYDSEVIGNLAARAVWSPLPQRLEWFFQDNFGQVRGDPLRPATPANRENLNYFTTGPDLTLRLGSVTRAVLSGRYSKVSYERNPFDNDRFGGGLALLRNLSEFTVLSLNLQEEKIEYDSASLSGADYDRQDAFLDYTASNARTRATLQLGYTVLDRSGDNSRGLLARIELRRQISSSSLVSLRLGREFSDAGSVLRLLQGFGEVSLETQSVLQTTNPFINEYAQAGWDFTARRTGFGVNVGRFQESYELQSTLDRNRTLASAYAFRALTPHLRFELRGLLNRENFLRIPGDSRELSGSAALRLRTARKFGVSIEYERFDRQADNAVTEFRENRGWLRLSYGRSGAPEAATLQDP